MAVPVTEAIIFDFFGVLYTDSKSLLRRHELNTELVSLIRENLKPHYKIGLLSNINREWIDDFLSKHGLNELFDAVVVSGDEGVAKPHPDIYHRMSETTGSSPDACIMIDDLKENCEGAEIAGMRSIHFISNDGIISDLRKRNIIP